MEQAKGERLGSGIHRRTYVYLPDTSCVLKEAIDEVWPNAAEMQFWLNSQFVKDISMHLAPCVWLSSDARFLIQKRARPVDYDALPLTMPSFLTDIKRSNFGMLDDRLVCIDYAMHITNASTRHKKVHWDDREV
jgi:hypothetical protein